MLDSLGEWFWLFAFLIAMGCAATLYFHPIIKVQTVERVVEKEVPVDHIVKIEGDCPPCVTQVKEIVKEPCPEHKCQCTSLAAWRNGGKSWWYNNDTRNP